MVGLTREDWAEIFYALEDKLTFLKETAADDKKWIAHIETIVDLIGPDGDDAAEQGVAPC